jgi:hypothetical protein
MKTTDPKTLALLDAALKSLPKRIACPKCKKNRVREAFGVRVMARDANGKPLRVARQSYCGSCRG